jgi:iron complex outermembrane receptor protein
MFFAWARGFSRRVPRGSVAAVVVLAIPALALAQPKAPTAPAAPAIPSAPAASVPAPPVSAAPAPPASAPPPPVGSASAPPPDNGDGSIVLFDAKPAESGDGVPSTLPRELRRNVKPGSKTQVQDAKGGALTVEEIVNSPIVSASGRRESALSAPAMVITVTAKDFRDRGYTDLSQMLDDLPGMDVIRPYGDVYVKSYWRGYRPGGGADPYLVMVDGIALNHLFYGDVQILSTFPLSSIDHVEIVYGPASAVYGRKAAMGVINVITVDGRQRQENGETGATIDSRFVYGGPQRNLNRFADSTKIADGTMFYTTKDWRLRLTTRLESSVLDRSIGDNFEYTKSRYYADPRIWGQPVLDKYPDLAGQFRSPDNKQAFEARLYSGNAEFGARIFRLQTGLGTRFAADRYQNSTPWTTTEMGVFGRHTGNLSPSVTATTLLQYRQSDVVAPSTSLGRYRTDGTHFDDVGPNLYGVTVPNSAFTAREDISISAARSMLVEGDSLDLGLGTELAHLEVAKGYDVRSNVTFPLNVADPLANARDDTKAADQASDGRNWRPVDEIGAYFLGKYAFPTANTIHLGTRYDYSSLTGSSSVTFRGGYVGTFDPITVRLLYGQAAYPPTTYDIYVANSKNLPVPDQEKSQTLEGTVSLTLSKVALSVDGYYIDYTKPLIEGRNLTGRKLGGLDASGRLVLRPIQIWAYYSRVLKGEDEDSGQKIHIADIAKNKAWGGITFDAGRFTATLLGRYIGAREPVATNPLGTVPAYFTMDANFVISNIFGPGFWTAFKVTNLLDAQYDHPGMQTAGSGNTPGVFSGTSYIGSKDDYNSRLPQPRRGFFGTLGFNLLQGLEARASLCPLERRTRIEPPRRQRTPRSGALSWRPWRLGG